MFKTLQVGIWTFGEQPVDLAMQARDTKFKHSKLYVGIMILSTKIQNE